MAISMFQSIPICMECWNTGVKEGFDFIEAFLGTCESKHWKTSRYLSDRLRSKLKCRLLSEDIKGLL
jgi:hypothetical protein